MRCLRVVVIWLYRQILRLYPTAFRELYAGEMESVFCRRLEEIEPQAPAWMLLLLLHEVRDLPVSLFRAYRRQSADRGTLPLDTRGIYADSPDELRHPATPMMQEATPSPWAHVGLAILPGLFMLVANWSNTVNGAWLGIGLAAICAVMIRLGIAQERVLPIWCYPACGLLIYGLLLVADELALYIGALIMYSLMLAILAGWLYTFFCLISLSKQVAWQTWLLLGCMSVGLLLIQILIWHGWPAGWPSARWIQDIVSMPLPVWIAVALAPFALRHDLRAALLVLGLSFWLWDFNLDYDYFLGGTAWAVLMHAIWILMLLVITPLWVLRARSMRERELALLLPVLLALVAIVPLETIARVAPYLLTDHFDLYRYVPDAGGTINGVGFWVNEPFLPALWRNIDQARIVIIHWTLVIALYRVLAQIPAHPGALPFTRMWQAIRSALSLRWLPAADHG